jgi:hypothetical protein
MWHNPVTMIQERIVAKKCVFWWSEIMKALHNIGRILLALIFCLPFIDAKGTGHVYAEGEQPLGPDRFSVITQEYISYEWWVTSYVNNQVVCSIKVDHEGLPTGAEIFSSCGKPLYDKWVATGICNPDDSCKGYYLQLIKTDQAQRDVSVELPPPVVWVSLDGCTSFKSSFLCEKLPTLVLTSEEPLEGEEIISLEGRINGRYFICDPICQVDLAPTDEDGQELEYWANSSYGDSSELFQARIRVIAADESSDHEWFVDILTSQWRGGSIAGCSENWNAFPPVGGVPLWLSTPQRAEELATEIPYEYLAGHLISQGYADASTCIDGGIAEEGLPNTCGLEASKIEVVYWQNRFDTQIFEATLQTGIPSRLIKRIFAQESQFWPGIIDELNEVGLGQMTKGGADTILLWNRPFYEQFCPSVLEEASCDKGYPHLQPVQQEFLLAALIQSVNAFCLDCEMGINIERAENSVATFAETILANCDQTGMIVQNTYGGTAGDWAKYEDLWRFTLVNYNAGPGCLTLAIWETKRRNETLNWANLSSHLTPSCSGAIDYVSMIEFANP